MARIQSRLLVTAVTCLVAGGCLKPEEPAPKYEYGDAAETTGEEANGGAQPWSPETALQNLDTNGDGLLALAEYIADRGEEGMRKETEIFAILDRNDDGGLTLQEFKTKRPKANFREIDLDGNGGLDLKEFYRGDMRSASTGQVQRAFQLIDRDDDGLSNTLMLAENVRAGFDPHAPNDG